MPEGTTSSQAMERGGAEQSGPPQVPVAGCRAVAPRMGLGSACGARRGGWVSAERMQRPRSCILGKMRAVVARGGGVTRGMLEVCWGAPHCRRGGCKQLLSVSLCALGGQRAWPLYWVWRSMGGCPPVWLPGWPGTAAGALFPRGCARAGRKPLPAATATAHIRPLKPRPLMPPPLSPGTCKLPSCIVSPAAPPVPFSAPSAPPVPFSAPSAPPPLVRLARCSLQAQGGSRQGHEPVKEGCGQVRPVWQTCKQPQRVATCQVAAPGGANRHGVGSTGMLLLMPPASWLHWLRSPS